MAMHLSYLPRPDRVTKTGVIAPYPIRQYDPVYLARQTIWPFIQGIRPVGPTWKPAPEPQPEEVAKAGAEVAAKGLGQVTTVKAGGKRYRIKPGFGPRNAVEAKILRCAYMIMRGQPFLVESAGRCVQINPQLLRAAYRRQTALSTGSVWDIIAARRKLYGVNKNPGAQPLPRVW